CLEYNSSPYSF
nr:immunoglobulin light chain junction region [Macaca mulatta]